MSVESVLARVATLEQALASPATLMALTARTGGTAAPAAASEAAPEAGAAAGTTSFAQALRSASESSTSTGASPSTETSGLAGSSDSASSVGLTGTSTAPGSTGLSPTATLPGATADAGLTGVAYPTTAAPGTTGASALAPAMSSALATPGSSVGARIVAIAESQAGQTEQPPGSNESPAIAHYRTATAGAIPGAPWCAYFASWAAREAGSPLGTHGEGLGAVSEIWSWAQSTGRAIANGPGVTPRPGDLIVFGDEHVGIVKDVLPGGDIQTIEGNYENKVALNTRTPSEATGYVNME